MTEIPHRELLLEYKTMHKVQRTVDLRLTDKLRESNVYSDCIGKEKRVTQCLVYSDP